MPYKDPEAARAAARRRYHAQGGDRRRAVKAAYKAANPEQHHATQERYRKANRDKITARRYGMLAYEYTAMVDAADGRCTICREAPEARRFLHVDHHHATGKVRGLLCHHCNTALGLMKEDTARLAAAVEYLRRFQC